MKSIWRPALQLHQNQAHRQPVRRHQYRLHIRLPWSHIDAKDGFIPPLLHAIVDVRAALTGWKSVPETSDLILRRAQGRERLVLQVAELLFTDTRLNMIARHLVLNHGENCTSSLNSADVGACEHHDGATLGDLLNPQACAERLLLPVGRQLYQVVRFAAVQRMVGVPL